MYSSLHDEKHLSVVQTIVHVLRYLLSADRCMPGNVLISLVQRFLRNHLSKTAGRSLLQKPHEGTGGVSEDCNRSLIYLVLRSTDHHYVIPSQPAHILVDRKGIHCLNPKRNRHFCNRDGYLIACEIPTAARLFALIHKPKDFANPSSAA